jgi:ATP-dependent Clp protease ATP-binding subunit ClpC
LLPDGEGFPAQVLSNLNVKLEKMREEVLNLLGHDTESEGGVEH